MDLKLMESKCFPGARYLACEDCRESSLEPRPLVVFGARYLDSDWARKAVKYHLYMGQTIEAEEIIP
jgi:hypothetical protein